MKLGFFYKVFERPTLEESLDGVQALVGTPRSSICRLRALIRRR